MSEQHYELNFIVSEKIIEQEVAPLIEKVKNLIIEGGGKITGENNLGRKKFAYPINHQKHGTYQIYEFDIEPEKLKKIDQELKLARAEIIRYLLIKKMIQPAQSAIPRRTLAPTLEKKEKMTKQKISLEDLDKKLDEILDQEIVK